LHRFNFFIRVHPCESVFEKSSMSYIHWIRQHVGHEKILLVFASACVRDQAGRVLWQRRADFGRWGLPGGVLELDESLPQCVVREVREETGLEVEPVRLTGLYTSPDFDVAYPNGDQVQQVTACFECRISSGECRIGDETLELAWFDVDAPRPTAPWYAAMVADLALGRKAASYERGAPGSRANGEPFFKQLRRHIGQAAFVMPGAAAVVWDEAGRVLLQRRGDTGGWALPAGATELGERIDQTVISEVREETGLEVRPMRLVGVYSSNDFRFTYPNGDQVKVVSALFECRAVGGLLQADGVESLEVRFFPLDALPPLLPRHARRIRDTLAGREDAIF
jgi:8-oxo-dGTP pyrophosphatase MutT (NUDIX family)